MVMNVFDSIDFLEPKCKGCEARIDFGVTTHYEDSKDCHICNKCGILIK